jgi:hypothetical protein
MDFYLHMLSPAVMVLGLMWVGAIMHNKTNEKKKKSLSAESSSPPSLSVMKRHKIRNEFIARPGARPILSNKPADIGAYRGWLVMAALLLLGFLARQGVKNMKKHGSFFSVDGGRFLSRIFVSEMIEFATAVLLVYIFSFSAYLVEVAKLRHPALRSVFQILAHLAMISLIVMVTAYLLVRSYEVSITFRFAVSAQAFVTYMKMVSYLGTNEYLKDLGEHHAKPKKTDQDEEDQVPVEEIPFEKIVQALAHRGIDVFHHLKSVPGDDSPEFKARKVYKELLELDMYRKNIYPRNVTLKNFFEFTCLPVLVYEPKYPRTDRIDYRNLVEKLVVTMAMIIFAWSLMEQFIIPALTKLIIHEKDASYTTLEAMLDLVVPLQVFVVLIFYTVFECILGANAEIVRLADREFYSDWWNSTSFEEFSRKWNKPVHEFLLRHVHIQAQTWLGLRRQTATIVTFIYSIVAHEIILIAMFGIFRPYLGFFSLFQIPLWFVMRSPLFQGKVLGNIVFWACLTLAWPIMSVLYCREYCLQDERNCRIY